MTITEFLLARIEEEEVALGLNLGDAVPLPQARATAAAESMYRRRKRAECEAKLLIVSMHAEPIGRAGPPIGCPECGGAQLQPCRTMRALALAYLDHADYDPAWSL